MLCEAQQLLRYQGGQTLTESLMEEVITLKNLKRALKRVRANKGAPGVDGMAVDELPDYLRRNWPNIKEALLKDCYQPQLVKKVRIPKPGGGTRILGVPTATDRFIQQALLQCLSPIFEQNFSESSYGFRPQRNAHQAVKKAQEYISEGYEWVVDIDLEKFFDQVNQDRLMYKLSLKIKDKRVLHLIRRFLNAGIMMDGVVTKRVKGMPQGGPLSPLLSNVYLDELDKELEERGHKFLSYADDLNIYVKSFRAGKRVESSIKRFISRRLKLKVNEEKSAVAKPSERKFLGFSFHTSKEKVSIIIAKESIQRVKKKVRTITRRSRGIELRQVIEELNTYFKGWIRYFYLNEWSSVLRALDGWIRRKLRCFILKKWKRKYTRYRRLKAFGLKDHQAWSIGGSDKGVWRLSNSPSMHHALNKDYFVSLGLLGLEHQGVLLQQQS